MAPIKRSASQSPPKKSSRISLDRSRSNSVTPAFSAALECVACRAQFNHQHSPQSGHSTAPCLVHSNFNEDEPIALTQPLAAESTQPSLCYNPPDVPVIPYIKREEDDSIDSSSNDEEFNGMGQAEAELELQPSTSCGTAIVNVRGWPNEIRISAGPYSSRSLVLRFITVIDSDYALNAVHHGFRFPPVEAHSSYVVHRYPQGMNNEAGNNFAPVFAASHFVDVSIEDDYQRNDFGEELPPQDFWNSTGTIEQNFGYWQDENIHPQMGGWQVANSSGGVASDEIQCNCMCHWENNYF